MRTLALVFGSCFAVVGTMHFVRSEFFVRKVPSYVPRPRAAVLLTGVADLAIGAALIADWHSNAAGVAAAVLITSYLPMHVDAVRTAPRRAARCNEALRFPVNAVHVGLAIFLVIGA